MGPLTGVLGMLPGLPKEVKNAQIDDKDVSRVEAIIHSMTPSERDDPTVLDGSRRLRIANGSGTTTTEVNNLLRQFKEMQKMMRSMPMGRLLGGGSGGSGGSGGRSKKSGNRKKQKGGGRVTPSSRHTR